MWLDLNSHICVAHKDLHRFLLIEHVFREIFCKLLLYY